MVDELELKQKIKRIKDSIVDMERNNDGSLQWVDDLRDLHMQLHDAEAELFNIRYVREWY